MQDFSTYVRNLRTSVNLTQEQAAEKLGVSLSTVKKWESGEVLPGRDVLLSIIRTYHADWQEFRDNLFAAIVPMSLLTDRDMQPAIQEYPDFPFYLFTPYYINVVNKFELTEKMAEFLRYKAAYQNKKAIDIEAEGDIEDILVHGAAGLPEEYTKHFTLEQLTEMDNDIFNAFLPFGLASMRVVAMICESTGAFDLKTGFINHCLKAAQKTEYNNYWAEVWMNAAQLQVKFDKTWSNFLLQRAFYLLPFLASKQNAPAGMIYTDGTMPTMTLNASYKAELNKYLSHDSYEEGYKNCVDLWLKQDDKDLARWDDADIFSARSMLLYHTKDEDLEPLTLPGKLGRLLKRTETATKSTAPSAEIYIKLNERGLNLLQHYCNIMNWDMAMYIPDMNYDYRKFTDAPWLREL